MRLSSLDWVTIAAYLLATLLLGLWFRRRSSRTTTDYFVSGRRAAWWLAGTSMVATTFAADTPLVVTGLIYANGIAGNWLWWSFLPSGMLTVFLFARLWHRSGLLTDVQFAEFRYAGRPAAFLRGFRALYLGLLVNCLILGWVTKAMTSIAGVVLGVSDSTALWVCILFLIPFTGIYVSLGGLWGVLWTDLVQFVLMMGIVIAVAFSAVSAVGGLTALRTRLDALSTTSSSGDILSFFPDFSRGLTAEAAFTLPALTLVVYLALQWWAFWYPGSEPGGGGYVAQRIFATRNERDGMLSVLWFNFAHYAVRPWPWILTALAAVILYPGLERPETGYILLATDHLPSALRGLLIAGFLAAYMSTVATHLNWGSSYLVTDFYRRFWNRNATEPHYVRAGRIATLLLVVASSFIAAQLVSIRSGWEILLEIGAGTGGVYLLRWYWWRINAWSEISAMVAALILSVFLRLASPFDGDPTLVFAKSALTTTLVTTLVWVTVTFLTPSEPRDTLLSFYRRVRPESLGWRPIAALATELPLTRDLARNLRGWLLGCLLIYSALLGVGKLLLGSLPVGAALLALSLVAALLLARFLRRVPPSASS